MKWSTETVRKTFYTFFESKGHKIVPSGSIVIKNDPSLMFTNAGMNQFKGIFLGNETTQTTRIANTQKCLRVSGKHNDLEEVGIDTYHHTMFEMLGNWSFGDYFKKEAIEWAWELLTEVYKIEKNKIYVTVFGGDATDKLGCDEEAKKYWEKVIPKERILECSKKDNFWEMGETGPCGPCSEIHVDLRSESEKKKIDGKTLVNNDHPKVIEIWNLVFIEFNRLQNGTLEALPEKHIDTGMGLERLCMTLQGKTSNYDIDIFQILINKIGSITGKTYGKNAEVDTAMRVVADHLRAIAFTISDGQLPSNNLAGYVVKRILRRAIRYSFSYLGMKTPFIYKLIEGFQEIYASTFPEIISQKELLEKVIYEEETSFLRTLERGIKLFEEHTEKIQTNTIGGEFSFLLYDTYGFPIDLTELMAREKELNVDTKSFQEHLKIQRKRSQKDAEKSEEDWIVFRNENTNFVGYEKTEAKGKICRYRKVHTKSGVHFDVVFTETPFYAEAGGQIGDTGKVFINEEPHIVFDTQKEKYASCS